jgi:hypothetical protein
MDQDTPERERVEHFSAALATALLVATIDTMDASQHFFEAWLVRKIGVAAYMKSNFGEGVASVVTVVPALVIFALALIAFGRRACIRAAVLGCAIGLGTLAWSMNEEIKTEGAVSVTAVDLVWVAAAFAVGLALVGSFDRIALRCWRMIATRFYFPQIKAWSETPAVCRLNWGLAGAAVSALGIWEIVEGFIREMAGSAFASIFVAACLLLGVFAVASAILSAMLSSARRPLWLQHVLGWVETP